MAANAVHDERCIPRLAPGREGLELSLSPAEGFLLSRIDGHTPWPVLRQIGGLPPEMVEACLQRWLSEGLVELPAGSSAPQAAADASLELSAEHQREILEFEASLDRSYYELLGVAQDADAREIKRAYFALSKRYHPDRYYRRRIGDFGGRLERIFRKLVEACELLSDPATRAELDRSLAQMPPEASAPAAPGPTEDAADARPEPPSKRERQRKALERLRRQFRIPPEILAERRLKARQFFEAASAAMVRERWREAAASIRLAIAFDPWSDRYKEAFASVQAQVHQLRASELLEQADASFDGSARSEALQLYEEALLYRPGDAAVNDRAARLAGDLGELERAQEYAEAACELSPETAAYHCTLARILRKAGLWDRARKAIDDALRLDPANQEARAERQKLRRSRRRG